MARTVKFTPADTDIRLNAKNRRRPERTTRDRGGTRAVEFAATIAEDFLFLRNGYVSERRVFQDDGV